MTGSVEPLYSYCRLSEDYSPLGDKRFSSAFAHSLQPLHVVVPLSLWLTSMGDPCEVMLQVILIDRIRIFCIKVEYVWKVCLCEKR
jgi:hypothetical protein